VWPALALSTSLIFVPHHAPTVYWGKISGRLLRQLQRATFSSCRSFKSHWLIARMQCHEGMHLLEQGSDSPRNEQMLPIGGANIQISLPSELCGLRFGPRYTRQPLHEAAN